MTQFEERVLRDLSELKVNMRWIIGNGNEGKMQEIEERLQKNEASTQRLAGVGAAFGIVLTILHLVMDGMRVMHR
jgi:hypothetical protein